jgi:hypothetical protein
MQQNDGASGLFGQLTQPPQLGPTLVRQVVNGPLVGCGIGIEYEGQVTPKDYSGRITLRRYATPYGYVWNMSNPSSATLNYNPGLHPDNGKDVLVTTTVTNGFVYDIDTPGPIITRLTGRLRKQLPGQLYRIRTVGELAPDKRRRQTG